MATNLFLATTNTGTLIERLKELLQDGYSPIEVGNLRAASLMWRPMRSRTVRPAFRCPVT
jgi:hypothetical protein